MPADDVAYLAQCLPGQPADLADLGDGIVVAGSGQVFGDLQLDGHQGKAVAEGVVEVAGDPGTFLLGGQLDL
jgi:hypothetical protein